jgi:hypothetical protein
LYGFLLWSEELAPYQHKLFQAEAWLNVQVNQGVQTMDTTRIRHVLNALMILSFLIFGGLVGIIFITDAPLVSKTVALPFAFLFLSMMTLVTTGQIQERPQRVRGYLRDWLIICTFGVVLCALAFTFG